MAERSAPEYQDSALPAHCAWIIGTEWFRRSRTHSDTMQSLYPTKSAELKTLHGTPRRGVIMAPGFDHLEVGSQNCAEQSRIVPHDRQAAAPLGPIQTKRAYDNVSAGSDGALQMTDIGGTVRSIGEEMNAARSCHKS